MLESFTRYSLSIKTIKKHLLMFLLFNPATEAEIEPSYPNIFIIMVFLTFASAMGYAISNLVTWKIWNAIADLLAALFKKPFYIMLIFVFNLIFSNVYSNCLSDGDFYFMYFYICVLSYVHMPLSILISNFPSQAKQNFYIFFVSIIQGIVAHYLVTKSLGKPTFTTSTNKQIYLAICLGGNILFTYIFLLFL